MPCAITRRHKPLLSPPKSQTICLEPTMALKERMAGRETVRVVLMGKSLSEDTPIPGGVESSRDVPGSTHKLRR